jgi:hypothetical protein
LQKKCKKVAKKIFPLYLWYGKTKTWQLILRYRRFRFGGGVDGMG